MPPVILLTQSLFLSLSLSSLSCCQRFLRASMTMEKLGLLLQSSTSVPYRLLCPGICVHLLFDLSSKVPFIFFWFKIYHCRRSSGKAAQVLHRRSSPISNPAFLRTLTNSPTCKGLFLAMVFFLYWMLEHRDWCCFKRNSRERPVIVYTVGYPILNRFFIFIWAFQMTQNSLFVGSY